MYCSLLCKKAGISSLKKKIGAKSLGGKAAASSVIFFVLETGHLQ
jgi:hypothetical protein